MGVVLAILGHRQMRKHPEVHQARGWAWATYLLAFAMVAIVGVAFAAINRETAAFEGRWSTGSGDVLVELDQTDLGTQLEGGFVLDAGTCTGQFFDGQLSDGAWEAEAVGTCTGDVPLEQSVTLRIVDGRLTGFGDEPLERRPS